jgi:starch synthase
MVASEVERFARTGGLGDVVAGLSARLADLGLDVVIVTPRYRVTSVPEGSRRWEDPVTVRVGDGPGGERTLGVVEAAMPARAVGSLRVCLLDHPGLYDRDGIYGDDHGDFGDNDVRYAVLSQGALAVAARVWPADDGRPGGPDVVHAHDWHAAPAVVSVHLATASRPDRPRTVFTIHNLAFQGVFGQHVLGRTGLPRAAFDDGTLAHDGQVNLMHGAIALADRVTTVSPTYAREIVTPGGGYGVDGLLRHHACKLVGILNGIDHARFDPKTDRALAERYDVASPLEGRARCKQALASEMGLEQGDGPLFAAVSRLTEPKGMDLLAAVVPALVDRGARVAILGSGDSHLEQALVAVASRYPGRVACRIDFDGALARRICAGADFFVMPSRHEPCGLTQLYAMRYGALPVVTAAGGLCDTVEPMHALFGKGTGWVAASADPVALLVACEDALTMHRDPASHREAVIRAMKRDSSWNVPARAYVELYEGLVRGG